MGLEIAQSIGTTWLLGALLLGIAGRLGWHAATACWFVARVAMTAGWNVRMNFKRQTEASQLARERPKLQPPAEHVKPCLASVL